MGSVLTSFCSGTNMRPEQLARYMDPRRPIGRREQLERFNSALEPLYWQAVRVSGLSRSYRDFRVSCAVFAYRAEVDSFADHWGVFYGMNTKVEEDSRPVCAEPIAVNSAYAAGYKEIVGILIIGEPQVDSYSGLRGPTLHCCHECRVFLRDHPIVPRHVRIFTALPPGMLGSDHGGPWFEVHTLGQMLSLHGEAT